jgi:hypothetical protein
MLDILYSKFCAATTNQPHQQKAEGEERRRRGTPTKRINQIHPPLPLKRHNLPTRTPHIRINIKSLPQMIYTARPRHSPHIQQYTHVRLEDGSESVEEPSMGVYFLLVLFFEAEYYLDGDYSFVGGFDFEGGGY